MCTLAELQTRHTKFQVPEFRLSWSESELISPPRMFQGLFSCAQWSALKSSILQTIVVWFCPRYFPDAERV